LIALVATRATSRPVTTGEARVVSSDVPPKSPLDVSSDGASIAYVEAGVLIEKALDRNEVARTPLPSGFVAAWIGYATSHRLLIGSIEGRLVERTRGARQVRELPRLEEGSQFAGLVRDELVTTRTEGTELHVAIRGPRGQRDVTITGAGGMIAGPPSPDGRWLPLYAYSAPAGSARIVDLATGQVRWQVRDRGGITAVTWRTAERLLIASGHEPAIVDEVVLGDRGPTPAREIYRQSRGTFRSMFAPRGRLAILDAGFRSILELRGLRSAGVRDAGNTRADAVIVGWRNEREVIVGASDGSLRVVTSDGDERTVAHLDGALLAGGSIAGELALLMSDLGSRRCEAVALDHHEGAVRWRVPIPCGSTIRCALDHAPPCVLGESRDGWITLRRLDPATGATGEVISEKAFAVGWGNFALSRDGARLAIVDWSASLRIIDSTGGVARLQPLDPAFELVDVAFEPSGAFVLSTMQPRAEATFQLFRVESEPSLLGASARRWPHDLRVSPEGGWLAAVVKDSVSDLRVIELDD
jgi:hypothetical protein